MTDSSNAKARALIESFVGELRKIAPEGDIPAQWREWLAQEILSGARKRGRPRDQKVTARNLGIARDLLQGYLKAERGGPGITKCAEKIADRLSESDGKAWTSAKVFAIAKEYEAQAFGEEIARRMGLDDDADRAQELRERLEASRRFHGELERLEEARREGGGPRP